MIFTKKLQIKKIISFYYIYFFHAVTGYVALFRQPRIQALY